ncbi:MAG TPA: 5'-3' exonuclease H3TH domain-containing protein [Mycoplasmatales bacterium]|nr:5'-3' exonuclease H3TH domain-containing protein [Mycoplasmatales bacterium]
MKIKKKCLIVDGNNLAYRSYYASQNLKWMKENKEIFIFLKILISIIKKNKYDKILFTFDEGKETSRKLARSDYKCNREKTPRKIIESLTKMKEIVERLGIKQESNKNYEADDIIASFIKKNINNDNFEFHIFSQDKDLFQLISSNVKILRYKDKKLEIFGEEGFKLENGFSNKYFTYYLALKGDKIDNIKGIYGIGDKRTKYIVSKFKNLEDTFSNLNFIPIEIKLLIENKREEIRKNIEIVSLVENIPLKVDWKDCEFSWDSIKMNKEFIEFCEIKKMKSIISMIQG